MVQFRLLGRTTRTKEHGGVKDVSVSIPEGFPQQGAYVLLLVMALSIKESIVMLLLNIYADIITSCKESIRMSSLFAGQFLNNILTALKEG